MQHNRRRLAECSRYTFMYNKMQAAGKLWKEQKGTMKYYKSSLVYCPGCFVHTLKVKGDNLKELQKQLTTKVVDRSCVQYLNFLSRKHMIWNTPKFKCCLLSFTYLHLCISVFFFIFFFFSVLVLFLVINNCSASTLKKKKSVS